MKNDLTLFWRWAERNHLTLADIARATEYSYNYVWNLKRGLHPVTNAFLFRLRVVYPEFFSTDVSDATDTDSVNPEG